MRSPIPRLDSEGAAGRFQRLLRRGLWRRAKRLRRVELVYLPFHLFLCPVWNPDGEGVVSIAADAVTGEMIASIDDRLELTARRAELVCAPRVSPSSVREKVLDHARWSCLEKRMFGLSSAQVLGCQYRETIAYPFWIGYVESGKLLDIHVLDGVSGQETGAKLKRVVLTAMLCAEEKPKDFAE